MLDEAEYTEVALLNQKAMESIKEYRERHDLPLDQVPVAAFYEPVCRRYEEITGFHETNPDAVMHHRISLYGPPCSGCCKPLRTPKASFCAECGLQVTEETSR